MEWRSLVAVLGILAALFVLIAWQKRQTKERAGAWLGYSALTLELLGLSLTVYWAVNAPDGVVLPIIFCLGFLGMIVGRAVLIPQIIKTGNFKAKFFIIVGLLIAYMALYSSGLFYAVNDAGYSAQERLESSAPAKALDAKIDMVRQRISSLATFADASRAHDEQQAIQQAHDEQQAQVNALESQLAQKRAELTACPYNYITKCIKPAKATIARLESQLNGLNNPSAGSGYAQKHDMYNGLQAHLVELQKERAALSENGQGIKSMWKPEDSMIAWLFDISEEKASQIKWLIFTFIFDFLSLMFRIVSAFIAPNDPEAERKQKFLSLLDAGLSLHQIASVIDEDDSLEIKPAKVKFSTDIPALAAGGRIESDGLIEAHAGECVLNAKATYWLDEHYPSLLDSANRGDFPAVGPANSNNANRYANEHSRQENPDKKAVGGVYQCQSCGEDYTAKTVWQKYCPVCSQLNRKRVLKAKSAQ
jgi:hypothetical protein